MTGLYSETNDDSSADLPHDAESGSVPSTITVTTDYDPGKTAQTITVSTTLTNPAITTTSITSTGNPDTVIKCHSRQPSASIVDREKAHIDEIDDEMLKDCGILSCRPAKIQKLARIKVSQKFFAGFKRFKYLLIFTDLCSSTLNAGHIAASPKFRLHKLCYHNN